MKTIHHLNEKVWYRLIKVVYVLAALFFLIVPPVAIYFNSEPGIDSQASFIKCNEGKTIPLAQTGVFLYSSYVSTYDAATFQKTCTTRMTRQEYIEKYGVDPSPRQLIDEWYNKPASTNYELTLIYETRNWFEMIGYILLSILITLVGFELIRRIFYYVVLGAIRPPNK